MAHRGGPQNAPENTIAAFERAFSDGADAIECDIRKTRDGQFVAFHDRTGGRLTGHNWPVAGTDYGQLKHIKVLGREPIAHLDDIVNLLIFHRFKKCYFEPVLEDPCDAAALALEIKKAGIQRRAYILAFSNNRKTLIAAKNAAPDIGVAVMPLLPCDIAGAARAAGASAVCAGWLPGWPGTKALFKLSAALFNFKEQAAAAAGLGVTVSAGIANDCHDARWLAAQGVGGIWTDDVPLVRKAIYGG